MGRTSNSIKLGVTAISIVVGLMAAGPAAGGLPSPFQVYVGKKADTATGSGVSVNIKKGKTKFLYYRVENDTSDKINVTLSDGETMKAPGFKVRWYKGLEGKEITDQVKGGGKPVNVPANGETFFRAKVKNKSGDGGFCLYGVATTRDNGDGATADVNNGGSCFL